ncbi:hypothetical protein LXA43DRAFT_1182552 [Ganoderma leucocontextum]|nr:hypothetical protein LXA43DRAFT_1182552 [Ganoderma leucocontextum]
MLDSMKSEFSDSSDSTLRASMTSLVSEMEQWEAHLSAFLSSYVYGGGLSALSRQGLMLHLEALGDIIQDMCAIFSNSFIRAARMVRRRRNSLALVNSLPDEVLLPIFLEATHNHPHHKINILVTCTRWRDVCSSDSSFWGQFLVPSSTCHARRAIAAAQGRPLDITLDFKTWNSDIQNVVSQRADTVWRLTAPRISLASKDTMGWLTSSFPALRELNLESGTAYLWADCILPPSGGSRHETPWTLSLSNCRFPYQAQCYSGLRSLSLVYHAPPFAEKEESENDKHLLDVLRACPQLEHLALCHPPMSTYEALAAAPPQPVPLHMLRRLRLRIHAQNVACLLEAIETSSETLSSVDIDLTDMKHWAGHELAWHKRLLDAPLTPFSSVPAHSLPVLGCLDSYAIRYGRSVVGRGLTRLRPSGQRAPTHFRLTFPEPRSLDDVDMRVAFDDFLAFLLSRKFLANVSRLRLQAFPSSEQALRILRGRAVLDVLSHIARTHRHSTRPIARELEAVALAGCTVDEGTLAELVGAVGSLVDLRVLSLERCDSELEEDAIFAGLRSAGNDGLDVRWVEDDPRRELRV